MFHGKNINYVYQYNYMSNLNVLIVVLVFFFRGPSNNTRMRLSLSAVNRMKTKNPICNRTITKCFLFYKNNILGFTTMFCRVIFQYFDYKCLIYRLNGWQKLTLSWAFCLFWQILYHKLLCCQKRENLKNMTWIFL